MSARRRSRRRASVPSDLQRQERNSAGPRPHVPLELLVKCVLDSIATVEGFTNDLFDLSVLKGVRTCLRQRCVECLTDSVTSIFFTLSIDGRIRRVHGYCDLADKGSPERMAGATITTIRPCSSATARIARLISLSLSRHSGPSPASSIPSTGLRRSGNVIARGWRSTSGGFPRISRGRVVSSPLLTNCLRSARSCVRSRRPWRNPLAMTLRCRASRPSPLLLTQRLDQVAYVLVAIFRR